MDALTFPGLTTPTLGDKDTGISSGTQNSNNLGPLGGATPLITALFMRDRAGLCISMVAIDVL